MKMDSSQNQNGSMIAGQTKYRDHVFEVELKGISVLPEFGFNHGGRELFYPEVKDRLDCVECALTIDRNRE